MLHTLSPTLSALGTELYATMATMPSIAGRVQDIIPGTISLDKQPTEYKVFLRLLHLSDYDYADKESIMNQDVICFNAGGADDNSRFNLIVYTLDEHLRVTRWGCYYHGEKKRDCGNIREFLTDIAPLLEDFEFLVPGV